MLTTIYVTDPRDFTEGEMEKLHAYWGIYKSATSSSITLNEFIAFCCTPCPTGAILAKAYQIAKDAVS